MLTPHDSRILATPTAAKSSSTSLSGSSLSTAAEQIVGAGADSAAAAASAATKTATKLASHTVTRGGAPFWQLLLAFTLGGLFFSTVAASVTAAYAFGLDNTRRLLLVVWQLVQKVWTLILDVLKASKDIVFGDYSGAANRFVDAWRTLKQGLGEARRVAAEGVESIRQEAKLYAAAVGAPGLIPLQYALDRLTPLSLAAPMEEALREAMAGATVDPKSQVRRLTLKRFKIGAVSPRLRGARLYDLGEEDMAFDVDVKWDSKMEIDVNCVTRRIGAKIPVSVRNVRFEGPVRVIVTRLREDDPGFGAMLVSFPAAPKIGMDIKVAGGEITRVPWLRSELTKGIQDAVKNELLWPKRIVVPAEKKFTASMGVAGVAGIGGKRLVLTSAQLKELERDDPLLRAERQLQEARSEDSLSFLDDRTDPTRPVDELDILLSNKEKDSESRPEDQDEEDNTQWYRRTLKKVTVFQRKLATAKQS